MSVLEKIESGVLKVLECEDGQWKLHEDVKRNILNEFQQNKVKNIQAGELSWGDKIAWLNFSDQERDFRMCPGAWVRRGTFIGKGVILMPCFVNIGAHIGAGTMIDSGATVGSCAYVGEKCHISSNAVLAGVLEPVQNMPVIVNDGTFIGAGCVIAEGTEIGKNCVIGAGSVITGSTRIYNRQTGEYFVKCKVPDNSVVVPGSYVSENGLNIQCAVIIKTLTQPHSSLILNELLRT